jgi:phosphonate transport system substrate-binding protein
MNGRLFLPLVLSFPLLWTPPATAAERPLVITTLPFDDPAEQTAVFAILAAQLADALGRPVVFSPSNSYDDALDRLHEGKADVGFLGAVAYLAARRHGDIRAVLRTIRKQQATYYGVIFVRRGSAITTLAQLRGKKVAFVDKSSGAGYLFPRLLLRQKGVNPDKDIQVVFAGGHHKVVRLVAEGGVDAGACFEGAEHTLQDPEAVTAIARTEPVPGDPVVVRTGLGAPLIKALRTSMIELASDPAAQPFFTFAEIDGFLPAVDADYDRLAELMRQSE